MTDELICSRCGTVIQPDQRAGGLRSNPPMHAPSSICLAALQARVAELEALLQWRPASEPPDEEDHYLVYRFFPPRSDPWNYDFGVYEYGTWDIDRVTHWRPLPPPPPEAPAQ